MNLQDWQLERQLTVLAVSGGVDSMVLLHVFNQLKLPCIVAHINFGLRGTESDGDTQLVEQTCKELNVKCFTKYFNTKQYASENKLSIQMAARKLRYDFFDEIVQKQNAQFIATAHHQDDEIENFFIYLIRNQVNTAFSGIPEQRGNIIRPFLNISRDEILQFAHNNGILYRNDSSNNSLKYLRNKIRHLIIPDMKREYENLAKDFQKLTSETRSVLFQNKKNFETFWANNVIEEGDLNDKINYKAIISNKLLDYIDFQEGFKLKLLSFGFSKDQINQIFKKTLRIGSQWNSKEFKIYAIRNGIVLSGCESNKIKIQFKLNVWIHFGKFKLFGKEILAEEVDYSKKNVFYFSKSIVKLPMSLRSWEIGDTLVPLGMMGRKNVSDIFIDKKININEKNDFPLLIISDETVAIIGLKRGNQYLLEKDENAIEIYWETQ